MRPYELLPLDLPANYDPAIDDPGYFYNNFAKKFIPDMIKMTCNGLNIDSKAVEDLRVVIDEVLITVADRLNKSPLIKQVQEYRYPKFAKKQKEEALKSIRTIKHYTKDFNKKDITHRTYVVNTYLEHIMQSMDIRDKWTISDLKKYNVWLQDRFIKALIKGTISPNNIHAKKGMKKLAEVKLELWNRPRYEKSTSAVIIPAFNPGSSLNLQELFEMLKIEPLSVSKKTGNASWNRDNIEELAKHNTDKELAIVLEALIDYSFSGIIKNNFIKAFDTYTIDGVLHGNVKLFGAKSFRNTSNNPNLLNAPSTRSIYAKPLKKCFIAPPGYIIFTADLSALEDRVIANLSNDTNKKNVFLEGLDGHSLNACGYFPDEIAKVLGKNTDNVKYVKEFKKKVDEGNKILDAIRFLSKAPTFKLAYGGFPDADKGGVITQEIFDNYHNVLYPGITKYREEYVLPATKKQGYIHLGLGCRLYADDPDNQIRTLNNATVQFWSILTLIAINELHYLIDKNKYQKDIKVIATIYDSVYLAVKKDAGTVKWVNDNLIKVMTAQYLKYEPIHNEAIGQIGNNWADLHTIKNNASLKEIKEVLNVL